MAASSAPASKTKYAESVFRVRLTCTGAHPVRGDRGYFEHEQ